MVKEVGNFNDKTIILTAIAQEFAQAQGKYKFRNADELVSDVNEVVSILEKQKEFEMNTGVNGEDTKEDKQTNRTAVDQTADNETIHNKYNRENCR
jgi:hypothetical protein